MSKRLRLGRAFGLVGVSAVVVATACVPEQPQGPPITAVTVTAPNLTVTYGDSIPAINPTNTPNVVLSQAPNCTTEASPLSDVGVYPIICTGGAYATATITHVAGTVTITPASLLVTASSATVIDGEAVPSITPIYNGLKAGDTQTTPAPACTTTATTGGAHGTYPSSCAGATDPNYSVTYVDGTVQLATARLTVTASSHSITQGDVLPTVTASYTGWVDGDTSIDAAPVCAPTVSTWAPAGQHATRCSGGTDAKYAFEFVDGTFDVRQAGLITYLGSSRTTTIAAGSEGLSLPRSSISVVTRTARGFTDFSNITVVTSDGPQVVFCTGGDDVTFTGCSGGTGVMSAGAPVTSAAPTDFNVSSLVPGGVANLSSFTVVSDVLATQRLAPSRVFSQNGKAYVRYLQAAFPAGSSPLVIGYCTTSATFNPGAGDCSTVRVNVAPATPVSMGAVVDVMGFPQNQTQTLHLAANSPATVKRGELLTFNVAAAATHVPRQQNTSAGVADVVDARNLTSVFPVPAGFEVVSASFVGGDPRSSASGVIRVCTQSGPGCSASRSGNWNQTTSPWVEGSLGSGTIPAGSSVTLPTMVVTLRATGPVGTTGTTGLGQFTSIAVVNAGVFGQLVINFNSYPTTSWGSATVPVKGPIISLMSTTIQ